MNSLFGVFCIQDGIPHLLLKQTAAGLRLLNVKERPELQQKYTRDSDFEEPDGALYWACVEQTKTPASADFSWHRWDRLTSSQLEQPSTIRALIRKVPQLTGRQWICSVVGCKQTSTRFTDDVAAAAFAAGELAADMGFAVLTGGLSGVMDRAAAGARRAGGVTIGILPGDSHGDANPHVRFAIPSGLGYARNFLMATASDVMIALPGGTGTLQEMSFAVDFNRPVFSWGSWTALEEVKQVPFGDAQALRQQLVQFINSKYQKESTHEIK